MKPLLRVLALALLAATASAKSLVLRHVTVIDVNTGEQRPDATVTIDGNRIAAVSDSAAVPKNAQVVDGTGKFLIPGLWDMHVHWYDKRYLPLFIANGVTGVRLMWGMSLHHEWRKEIESGSLVGPRLVIASAIIDGPRPIWPESVAVRDEAGGRAAVDEAKAQGADFVKVYSLLPREAFFAILAEARKQNLPVAGHVPGSVRASEASDAGMKSIEHLTGVLLESSTHEESIRRALVAAASEEKAPAATLRVGRAHAKELIETYDAARAAALFSHFVKNGTWQCPTLTVQRSFAYGKDPEFTNDARLRYMPEAIRTAWDPKNDFRSRDLSAAEWATRKTTFAKALEIVGDMRKAGVQFLAGTDTLNPFCFPGFSLHDELALLVQAGLTPLESLRAATVNPATFLGLPAYGSVEKGNVADLVLLDANPLEDIRNTRKIAGVVFDGTYFPRAKLDRMLAGVERVASGKGK